MPTSVAVWLAPSAAPNPQIEEGRANGTGLAATSLLLTRAQSLLAGVRIPPFPFDLAMIETVGLAAWDNSAHGAQCLDQSCNVLTAYALNFGGLPRTNRP